MNFNFHKLTKEALAALGNPKDANEASAAVLALVASANANEETANRLTVFLDAQDETTKTISANASHIADLEQKLADLHGKVDKLPTAEAIRKDATDAGSHAAALAIANGTGLSAPIPADAGASHATNQPANQVDVEALIEAGEWEQAWKASETIRAEYGNNKAAFLATMKAREAGWSTR